MTRQSERRDQQLRDMPDGYVDPARRHRSSRPRPRAEPRHDPSVPPATAKRKARLAMAFTPSAPDERAVTIPRHARLGIMFMALQSSIPQAAKLFKVPESTLYAWFREEGGIQEVREYVAEKANVSFQRLVQVMCDELSSRMEGAPNDELFASFRKMVEAGEGMIKKRKRAESESGPEGAPAPSVVLQFSSPPALPEGSRYQGNNEDPEQSPPEDVAEGEVTDVFDD